MTTPHRLLPLLFVLTTTTSPAATFEVNRLTDAVDNTPGDAVCEVMPSAGDCTLRAAIMEANALAGDDIINLPAGVYALTIDGDDDEAAMGDLDIVSGRVEINGAGAGVTIIDGNGIDRVFQTSAASVAISDLTIRGGATDAGTLSGGAISMNGAQVNANDLTLTRVHLLNNQARLGGAIRATPMTVVLIEDSLLQGNQTSDLGATNRTGAAIYCQGCNLTVMSTTISDNQDDLSGKVVEVDGGGTIRLLNSTLTGSLGGGVRAQNGNVSILFSTLVDNGAQNLSFFSSDDSHVFEVGNSILQNATHDNCQTGDLPVSLGYNVVGDASCSFSAAGDLEETDALLAPLADNGGPTRTFLPMEGSDTLDRVPISLCTDFDSVALMLDQRGSLRPVGLQCDGGSVEVLSALSFKDGFESDAE